MISNILNVGIIVSVALVTTSILSTVYNLQPAYAIFVGNGADDAPAAITGDNIYVVWWSNKTGNDEVMFRASTDGGATFSDKINLSNTTAAESEDAEIAAEGANVIVTWWERNQTASEPVARLSTDDGATFGQTLNLATNGTIGEAAEGEEGEEEGESP
jgi:hypothetical protein